MIDANTVEKLLEEFFNQENGYFSWDELEYHSRKTNELTIETSYPFEVLEEYTGTEGDYSASTYVIFKVGDKVFKKTGHYQSHYGNDWDGPVVEVKPVEKTITTWEEV